MTAFNETLINDHQRRPRSCLELSWRRAVPLYAIALPSAAGKLARIVFSSPVGRGGFVVNPYGVPFVRDELIAYKIQGYAFLLCGASCNE